MSTIGGNTVGDFIPDGFDSDAWEEIARATRREVGDDSSVGGSWVERLSLDGMTDAVTDAVGEAVVKHVVPAVQLVAEAAKNSGKLGGDLVGALAKQRWALVATAAAVVTVVAGIGLATYSSVANLLGDFKNSFMDSWTDSWQNKLASVEHHNQEEMNLIEGRASDTALDVLGIESSSDETAEIAEVDFSQRRLDRQEKKDF